MHQEIRQQDYKEGSVGQEVGDQCTYTMSFAGTQGGGWFVVGRQKNGFLFYAGAPIVKELFFVCVKEKEEETSTLAI